MIKSRAKLPNPEDKIATSQTTNLKKWSLATDKKFPEAPYIETGYFKAAMSHALSETWNRLQPGAQASRHGLSLTLQATFWIPAIRLSAVMTGYAWSIVVLPNKTPFAPHGSKEAHLPPHPPLFIHPGIACNTSEEAKEGCTNNKAEETARNFTDFLPRRVRKSGSTDYSSEKYGKWLHRLVHSLPTRNLWLTHNNTYHNFQPIEFTGTITYSDDEDCVFRSGVARYTYILLVSSNHLNNGLAVIGDQITQLLHFWKIY